MKCPDCEIIHGMCATCEVKVMYGWAEQIAEMRRSVMQVFSGTDENIIPLRLVKTEEEFVDG